MATSLAIEEDFDVWLTSKLNSLNTDENVFGSYITGILTGDETFEEKNEALQGIIGEITQDDIAVHCQEILEKWYSKLGSQSVDEPTKVVNDDVEDQLVKLFEKNSHATTVQKKYTDDERKLREAILAQYSQTSDQEEDEPEERHEDRSGENGLVKNTNVQNVIQAQKEKREKAKIDSQKKKEKDREDRDRQKKEAAEKKEKRKTQKQERKR